MKNLIAISAVLVSANAFAFFENGNMDQRFVQDGRGEAIANAGGEGEATFTMSFTGKGKTAGDFKGNGSHNGNFGGRGYGYENPYYAFPAQEK